MRLKNRNKLLTEIATALREREDSPNGMRCLLVSFFEGKEIVAKFYGVGVALDYIVNDIVGDNESEMIPNRNWANADHLTIGTY